MKVERSGYGGGGAWLGLAALRVMASLSYRRQRQLSRVMGRVIHRSPLAQVRIARRNLEICYPELTEAARARLLVGHCQSVAMGLCETAVTWWGSDRRVKSNADLLGLSHIHAALTKGNGVILIGGHFTTIEIATRILGAHVPLNFVYRPPKNALVAKVMHKSFARHGKPIAYDDIRSMIRALRNNEIVWYAPDQSYRNKGAAMVPFFGVPAATTTATSRLAAISGAAVLTYFPERLPGDAGYRLTIGQPLSDFPSGNAVDDAERFGRLLEQHIQKVPEQYLWMHRRFKGLGSGYPDFYGKDGRHAQKDTTAG
jgi:KDO2-lipid IV(A) lauroyltransferase